MVSVDVKQHLKEEVLSELRSCVKVEVDVQGSPSLIVRVDVMHHLKGDVLSELRSCVKVEVGPRPYGRKLKQH